MKSPEKKLFRAIITQAIEDAMYDGLNKYEIIAKREAIHWLTSTSYDFKLICHYADIDYEYASMKFAKAMKLDMYQLKDKQINVIQKKPARSVKTSGQFRLNF
jgi:hypothetical protein